MKENINSNILIIEDNDEILNKTFQEIYNAVSNGQVVAVKKTTDIIGYEIALITYIGPNEFEQNKYFVATSMNEYYADSLTDYPGPSNEEEEK